MSETQGLQEGKAPNTIEGEHTPMCGIAGIYQTFLPLDKTYIRRMTDTLKHRGPDDEGYLAVNTLTNDVYELTGPESKVLSVGLESLKVPANLYLGHRRLSILDLTSSGHQPMSDPQNSFWVVYNGEIYNYLELRNELKNLGYSFKTSTDTEVLLAAYHCWGFDCLQKFNGMWAFVIFDRARRILFGARDRFGVKPLYYYLGPSHFAFASEIKALLRLPFISKRINGQAVFDYLVFAWVEHEEEGFFKGIFELPPSFAFVFDTNNGTLKKWRYYSLLFTDSYEPVEVEKKKFYAHRLRELLYQAISLRLRSDVPIGTCLSGGLDSSTVVCILNELLKKGPIAQVGERQKVFTAFFPNSPIDESKWAEEVVVKTSTTWYRVTPKSHELAQDLERLIYIQEIPFGSTSIYAQYRVMKLAREAGVKVLLDGQGGDELFGGYLFYYPTLFTELIKNSDFVSLGRELLSLRNTPIHWMGLIGGFLKMNGVRLIPKWLLKKWLQFQKETLRFLDTDLWHQYSWRVKLLEERIFTSLNEMLHAHMTGLNLKSLLRYEDRNSMAFSLEARTPMADDIPLIEFLFQIPSVYKIYRGWSKHLLREAMTGVVPEKIRWRKDKIGFATPETEWLAQIGNPLKEYFTKEVGEFVQIDKIHKDWPFLLRKTGRGTWTDLWRFINFAVWMKVFRP